MPWKDDMYSKVKGPEKIGRARCIGKIPKPKKLKASLSENQELRDKLKQMEKKNKIVQMRCWQMCCHLFKIDLLEKM
jgi:hypothetical protein